MTKILYPDIPRMYTAIAEWSMCLIYVLFLNKRYSRRKTTVLCGAFLLAQMLLLVLTGNVPLQYWILCMICAAGAMFLLLYANCKITAVQALYCCATAFMMAEFLASMEWQTVLCLRKWNLSFPGMDRLIFVLIYAGVFGIGYYLEATLLKKEFLNELSRWELISTIGLVVMTFALSNINFLISDDILNNEVRLNIFKMRTLIDFSGIAVLYAFQSRVSDYISKKEIATIHTMLKSQYDQYRSYQESMELLRIQRHDLKHHIAILKAESDQLKKEAWLDMMEEQLDSTDYIDPTGNNVLDVMLSAKQQLMKKNKIHFTCVADGVLLDFMHVTDICTVIGNALDNAIESVVMIENPEKRMIHFSLSRQNHFIFLQIRNYCEREPVWDGKELRTTKKDKKNHGYGVKSIQYSIEKYGGNLTVGVKDHWFELGILIPQN